MESVCYLSVVSYRIHWVKFTIMCNLCYNTVLNCHKSAKITNLLSSIYTEIYIKEKITIITYIQYLAGTSELKQKFLHKY